jgi:hypothetical protein
MSEHDSSPYANEGQVPLAAKLNLETAPLTWKELEPFFAAGKVIHVATGLDMFMVAEQIVADNKAKIEEWMAEDKVGQVSDAQAAAWHQTEATLWSVVIKPWILVQAS